MTEDCLYVLHSGQPSNQGNAVTGVTSAAIPSGYIRSTPTHYGDVFLTTPEQFEVQYSGRFDDRTYYTA